jgi:hypothetical protein
MSSGELPKSDSDRGFSIDGQSIVSKCTFTKNSPQPIGAHGLTVCRLFDVLQNERLVHVCIACHCCLLRRGANHCRCRSVVPQVLERQPLRSYSTLISSKHSLPLTYTSLTPGRRPMHPRIQASLQGSGSSIRHIHNLFLPRSCSSTKDKTRMRMSTSGIPSLSVSMMVSTTTTLFCFAVMEARQQVL